MSVDRANAVISPAHLARSTTLDVGQVSFTIDTRAVWTITSTSGRPTDICSALS